MSDYIKREDALAVIYGQHVGGKEACENARPNTFGADLREIAYDIEDIPAADVVEREKGEWVSYPDSFKYEHVYDRDAIVCPFCEQSWNFVDNDTERFNFCPNCGADMREER